jgi:hypothetical protein
MSNAKYEIEGSFKADTAALDATIAKLQGQIEATKTLGKDTAELEAQLLKLQQTKVASALNEMTGTMQEAGGGAKKAAEGTGEFLEGRHGIHAIGHALNQAMPGLMQFTRFLQSGFTAAIGVVLLAFEYLKSKIEEFSKMLDELNSGPGARGEWAEKTADNVREAAVEEAVFNERLRETADRQNTLSDSTEKLIAAQKRQAEDAKALGDAQKELELARLTLAEKLGQISPEQAVRIRLQIDDAAFTRELEAKKAAIQAELSARQQELTANEGRESGLSGALDSTSSAALAAKNAADKNAARLAQDKANKEKAEAEQKENDKKLLELTSGSWISQKTNAFEIKFREAQAEKLQAQIGALATAITQETGKQSPLETAAAVAKQQAEKAKSDYEEAAKLSAETLKTVEKLKADLAAATAQNAALQNIHRQTSAVTAAGADADMVNRVNAGHGTPQENQQVADRDSQHQWSQTPREGIDLGGAWAALGNARAAVATGQGSALELRSLFNEFIGLAHDLHASAATRSQFEELSREVSDLRSQIQYNR